MFDTVIKYGSLSEAKYIDQVCKLCSVRQEFTGLRNCIGRQDPGLTSVVSQ